MLLHCDVPDLFDGDIVLFVHIVPLMAALALRPHIPRDEYAARLGRLDFGLLIVWWFYLYALTVMPWQYVMADVDAYNRNLNAVYLSEKVAFLLALLLCWNSSKGAWRKLYANLFGVSFCYSAGSWVANWAIARNLYYSGSAYDIPLGTAMAWLTWIGLRTKVQEPAEDSRQVSTAYGVWIARAGMIAVFSLPVFAVWALSTAGIPARIRLFRVELTLCAALAMGIMIFVRQHLLDRELLRLLNQSQESIVNLKRLQAQITESEKLASIGQLVGGAAHELNNPIAAMMGYSDLLLNTSLDPQQHDLVSKIGQHIRRTKSLVASLISFAKPGYATMGPVDMNTIVRTSVKLSQPQWKTQNVELRTVLQPELPSVLGDSSQLLQICVQLLNSAIHALSRQGRSVLMVRAEHKDGVVTIHIFDLDGQVSTAESRAAPSESGVTKPSQPISGLDLSACQGILQQHRGRLSWQEDGSSATSIRVELPVMAPATRKSPAPTGSQAWEPRPSA